MPSAYTAILQKHWRVLFALFVVVVTSVTLVLWPLLDEPSMLPDNDYWGIFSTVHPDGRLALDSRAWLARNNEHIVFIPALVYSLNFELSGGHNLGLQLTSLGLSICIALLLIAMLPEAIRRNGPAFVATVVLIAILSFTPNSAHSWFLGFSGIIWLGAELFFLVSIAALRLARDRSSFTWFAVGTLCALASYFNYSTGTMALPLGFVFLVWWRAPKAWIGAYVVLCALAVGLTAGTVSRPSYHPEWLFDPTVIAQFVGRYFGYFTSQIPLVASAVGLIGIALYVAVAGVVASRDWRGRSDLAIWVLITAFPLGAALTTAFSRSGFGLHYANASRYAGLASLFWIGVLVLVLSLGLRSGRRMPRLAFFGLFALVGVALVAGTADRKRIHQFLDRNHEKRFAEVGLVLDIVQPDVLVSVLSGPDQLISRLDMLKDVRHVPFAGRPECATWLGWKIRAAKKQRARGNVDVGRRGSSGQQDFVDLAGWATYDGARAKCIAILDETGKSVGVGVAGFWREDVRKKLGIEEARTGWRLLKPGGGGGPWYPVALFPGAGWLPFGHCVRARDGDEGDLQITKCD